MKSLLSRFKWPFRTQATTPPEPLPEPRFESAPAPTPPARRAAAIELQTLQQLFPLRTLDEDTLKAFVLDREADIYPEGSILFRQGEPAHSVHYLLQGRVALETAEGTGYEIQAGSAQARFPLYAGRQYNATAQAKTEIQVLRISAQIMAQCEPGATTLGTDTDPLDLELPDAVRDNPVFQAFHEHYLGGGLALPTLPTVAAKLGQAIERDCHLRELAGHVQLDPVIGSRLVSVANSPLYHAGEPVNSCHDAIAVLGMAATRNLVLGLCLKRVFESKEPRVNALLHTQWKQSLQLSALCYVLAGENGGIDREEALLAGLIADIGALPFLYFLARTSGPAWSEADVQAILPLVRGPLGAHLLGRWHFPAELARIPCLAENWYHDGGPRLDLADIVILSKLHAYIGTPRRAELPAINAIPAFSKLKEGKLSPELSLDILAKAKHKIGQALKVFSG